MAFKISTQNILKKANGTNGKIHKIIFYFNQSEKSKERVKSF